MNPGEFYNKIVEIERKRERKEIVIFLFAQPTETEILQTFAYLHYNSGKFCNIFAIGYTDDRSKLGTYQFREVNASIDGEKRWLYSDLVFVDVKNYLEERINWKYSGETDLLILQSNPEQRDVLDFTNCVAINVKEGIKEGYISSFRSFMEALVRSAHTEVTPQNAVFKTRMSNIRLIDVLIDAVIDTAKIPGFLKKFVKNGLFRNGVKVIR